MNASKIALGLVVLALPLAACQTASTTTGAATGAVTGAVIGGPVGAAVGGVAGAAAGAALSADESTRVRQYVYTQRRPSVRLASEQVVVGEPLPPRVRLYPVPATVGLQSSYSYTIINDQPVLVDPTTRQVVTIIE